MNRRPLAVLAVVIAVPLFTIGLISPVPNYGPHLNVNVGDLSDGKLNEETPTVKYQNLSPSTQHLFDRANKREDNGVSVPINDAPASWSTLVSEKKKTNEIYIQKDEGLYAVYLSWNVPTPSFITVMIRLGPLLSAIGLGTLAGVLVLRNK